MVGVVAVSSLTSPSSLRLRWAAAGVLFWSSGATVKSPLTTMSLASVTPPRRVPPLIVNVPVPSEPACVTASVPSSSTVPPVWVLALLAAGKSRPSTSVPAPCLTMVPAPEIRPVWLASASGAAMLRTCRVDAATSMASARTWPSR